jgi:hypothetical protein
MNILIAIAQAGQLIASFIVPTLELALKLKHNVELTPDFQVNITNLAGEAVSADDETTKLIADWKTEHGLS